MAFSVGDLVWLKAGGVRMVVNVISDDGLLAKCLWQDETAAGTQLKEHIYPVVVLTASDPNDYGLPMEEPAETPASDHAHDPGHFEHH